MTTTLTAVPYSYTEVVLRQQLVYNPDFVVNTTGWAASAGVTIARTGSGTAAALAVTVPAAVGAGAYVALSSVGAAAPLTSYTVMVGVGLPGGMTADLVVEEYNAANALIGSATVAIASTETITTYTTHAAGAKIRPYIKTTSASAGTFYIDRAQGERASTYAGYFDGDTSNAGLVGKRYTWTGTAHNSVSRLTERTPTALATSVTPALVTDYSASRASATVLHEVIGRADPLPALGPLRTRTGTLEVWCATEATAHAVVALYALGKVVMLHDPDHLPLEMYHVVTDVEVRPDGPDKARWLVTVDYAEVYSTAGIW